MLSDKPTAVDILRTKLVAISHRSPFLAMMLRRVYYCHSPFNGIRKKVIGDNNRIYCDGSVCCHVSFDIRGNGNNICLGSECLLNRELTPENWTG